MNHLIKILAIILFCGCLSCKYQNDVPVNLGQIIRVDTIPLKLIDNTKWNANKATQIGMQNIDSIVKNFQSLKRRDFKNLGAILSKETSTIIKKCDMTGQAHDQLHLVLVPILDQVVLLKEDHDIIEKNTAIKNIENLLKAYYQYFKY